MLSWWQGTSNLLPELLSQNWGWSGWVRSWASTGFNSCYRTDSLLSNYTAPMLLAQKQKHCHYFPHGTWHGQWAGNNILASCSLWLASSNCNERFKKKYFYLLLWLSTITIASNKKLYFCLFAVANQVQQDFGVLMQHHITLITISLNC